MTGRRQDKKPETPDEGLIGRRGYADDPLEGASGPAQDGGGRTGAPETRQQSDPAANQD